MANILVADDDSRLRQLLRLFLEAEDHQVSEAADGAAALRAVRSGGFHLLLCDVFMPGLDGLETLRQLRREFPGMRAVAMSGGDHSDQIDLLDPSGVLGSVPFIKKPFSCDDVRGAVSRALRHAVIVPRTQAGRC